MLTMVINKVIKVMYVSQDKAIVVRDTGKKCLNPIPMDMTQTITIIPFEQSSSYDKTQFDVRDINPARDSEFTPKVKEILFEHYVKVAYAMKAQYGIVSGDDTFSKIMDQFEKLNAAIEKHNDITLVCRTQVEGLFIAETLLVHGANVLDIE